jgi:hypothetical protein
MIISAYPRYRRIPDGVPVIKVTGLMGYYIRKDYKTLRREGLSADITRHAVWGLLLAGRHSESIDTAQESS